MDGITPAAGFQGLTCSIHWLAFTTKLDVEMVFRVVAEHLYEYSGENPRGMFHKSEIGMDGYKERWDGRHGVKILYTPGREDLHVIIPGEACEHAEPSDLLKFFRADLVRFRRIDFALDGLVGLDDRPVKPIRLYSMCKNRPDHVKTWANIRGKRRRVIEHGAETTKLSRSLSFAENDEGQTCYIGSRKSERFVRVYDRRGFTRLEMQLSGERAERTAETFDRIGPVDLCRVSVGLVRDFLDFIDPKTEKLQPWWDRLVGDHARLKVTVKKDDAHLSKTWQALKFQYGPTLAVMLKWSGGDLDVITEMASDGKRRISSRHEKMLDDAGGAGSWRSTQQPEISAGEDIGMVDKSSSDLHAWLGRPQALPDKSATALGIDRVAWQVACALGGGSGEDIAPSFDPLPELKPVIRPGTYFIPF